MSVKPKTKAGKAEATSLEGDKTSIEKLAAANDSAVEAFDCDDHSSCCTKRPKYQESQKSQMRIHSKPVKFGVHAGVGVLQGKRPYMEDRHRVIYACDGHRGFFSIFDGHGGSEVSEYSAKHLYEDVMFHMDRKLREKGQLDKNPSEEDPELIKDAFKEAYIAHEQHLNDHCRRQAVTSGTTNISVMIRGNRLYCANVGDCRAVISNGGRPEDLSRDHKPSDKAEKKRIESAGGTVSKSTRLVPRWFGCLGGQVEKGVGAQRMWPGGFAVTRSFGDILFKDPKYGSVKQPGLIAEPEIEVVDLTRDDSFVIIASDGFWDIYKSKMAVKLVAEQLFKIKKMSVQEVAQYLADRALTYGSMDNITVIVLVLTHHLDDWGRTDVREEGKYKRGDYVPYTGKDKIMQRLPHENLEAKQEVELATHASAN
eukprot:175191_1